MIRDRWFPLLWAFAAMVGCARPATPPSPAVTPAAVRAAVDSQFAGLFEAYRRRDGTAFASFYASDAEMHSPGGTLSGQSAIQADMQGGLAGVASVTDDTATTDDFLATADHAIQVGHIVWRETSKAGKSGRTQLTFAFTWRPDPTGVWRITHDLDFETALK